MEIDVDGVDGDEAVNTPALSSQLRNSKKRKRDSELDGDTSNDSSANKPNNFAWNGRPGFDLFRPKPPMDFYIGEDEIVDEDEDWNKLKFEIDTKWHCYQPPLSSFLLLPVFVPARIQSSLFGEWKRWLTQIL